MYQQGGPFLAMRGPFITAAGSGAVPTPVVTVGPVWTDNADGTATVTFTTDIATYGGIDFGTSTGVYTQSAFDYDGAGPDLELATSHTVPVPDAMAGGTLPDDTYYYRVWGGTPAGFSGYISDEDTGVITSLVPLTLDTQAKGTPAQPTVSAPYQYTHTLSANTTKVLVAVTYLNPTGASTISAVTCGGEAMTAQGAAYQVTGNLYIRVYEIASPSSSGSTLFEVTTTNVSDIGTGMGISIVSFLGGDPAASIRGAITQNKGFSASMTVTQSSNVDDIILCFGASDNNTATITYSAGTKVGTDAAIYSQSIRTVGQRAGAASAAVTASVDFSNWAMWSMSVKGS